MMSPFERMTEHLKITEEIALAIRALGLDGDAVYEIAQNLANRLIGLGYPKKTDEAWVAELDAATGTAVEFINWCVAEAGEGSLRGEGALVAFALGDLRASAASLYSEAGLSGKKPMLFSLDYPALGVSQLELGAAPWLRLCELFSLPVTEEWATVTEQALCAEREEAAREAADEEWKRAERTDEWYEELAARIAADALERGEPISSSTVQRRYGIGFGIAMRAIDALVAAGVAEESEADGRRVYRILKAYK